MSRRRLFAGLSGVAIAALTLTAIGPAALADEGRGPGTENRPSAPYTAKIQSGGAPSLAAAEEGESDKLSLPTSYPHQPRLNFYRDNPTGPNGEADFNTNVPELVSHPDIAPALTDLMERSNRVSTQVIGQSTQGRDLYLVTVTAPETETFTAQQTAWRDKIRNNPVAAKSDAALLSGYKTPIWISNNIHGNEWEGTDAALQYIEYLATAPMSEVGSILRNNRIYFSPSLNPDGRTNATRATALGLDPNRDMITLTTPETASFVQTADAVQAIYNADFHGYTSVLQMEPTGPPHGSNYEYDLYIPHNYALALAVEKHVTGKQIPGNTYLSAPKATGTGSIVNTPTDYIKIPYRDTPSGWDDFPPIFTAQYAAFYGAITATVEIPWSRNRNAGNTGSGGVLISADRAKINTEVSYETMVAIVDYLNRPAVAKDLLLNQIETFRRGVEGEPKVALTTGNIADVPGPDQWKAEWDSTDDQEAITLPRAYVIPVGDDQRSASDANRLVQRLIDVGLEVGTLDADTTVGGTTYPKGSYVVDMHQPLRGLANALLDLGEDISQKLPSMYDISAWSLGYIWGADVDKVGLVTDPAIGSATRIDAVNPNHSAPSTGGYSTFELAGVADYQAVNELLDQGVAVTMIEDGSVVVADSDAQAVAAVAAEFDIAVEQAGSEDLAALSKPSAKGLSDLKVAYVGNQDDRLSLTELGFDDLVQITAAGVNSNPAVLDDVDVIWVGAAFTFSGAQATGRAAVQSWLDEGGSIVGRTASAYTAANAFGLLSATAVAGNGSGNGIVAVDTPEGSVLEPYKQDTSFVYPAVSFTNLGEGTKAEQSYGAGNPLLAGHWRSTNATNGPEVAAGNASVISGEAASGAKALVFGTSVFFRTHPKGGLSQAARGLFWAAPEGEKVIPPTRIAVTPTKSTTRYGQPNAVAVSVSSAGEPVAGQVEVRFGGKVVGTPTLSEGKASVPLPAAQKPGTYALTVKYQGSDTVKAAEATRSLKVLKAKPAVSIKLAKSKISTKQRGKVTVTAKLPGASQVSATGKVRVKVSGKSVRTVTLSSAKKGKITVTLPKLKKGTRTVQVELLSNSLQERAVSKGVKLRVG
ncbi:Ig-like domain repeat protein [Leucobacter weissii]|uniref:Ig-like domain repeat protein n=1 Tax=Leucobacter weissii TaxID=1983706 RepID=A0A939MQ48_9MICO|nr:M14 family metallopeptidase [Leucobacter weissii]MBO1900994.1 Ig-like domain repeat protein [Leucobacter weissii]